MNPFTFLYKAYRDIQLWFFIQKMVREHKKTADWARYNLRADWVGRIYTVLNPELPSDAGDSKEVLRYKYTERLHPITTYVNNLGLGPYVRFAWEEVKDSDSYLIAYIPMFEVITFWRIIGLLVVTGILLFTSLLPTIGGWIQLAWNAFF